MLLLHTLKSVLKGDDADFSSPLDSELFGKLKVLESQSSASTFREDVIEVCKSWKLRVQLEWDLDEYRFLLECNRRNKLNHKDCHDCGTCGLYKALPQAVQTYTDILEKIMLAEGLSNIVESDVRGGEEETEEGFQITASKGVRGVATITGGEWRLFRNLQHRVSFTASFVQS